MYGFTSSTLENDHKSLILISDVVYNRTGIQAYLDTARRVSTYYVDNLPIGNIVPPWSELPLW